MRESRIVRLSVGKRPARVRQTARAIARLIEHSGLSVEIVDRGSTAPWFKATSSDLVEGTTDCILVPGNMLSEDLAKGINLDAVLARDSSQMGLLAISGLTHPTLTNPIGLDCHATVGVSSFGQQSQLSAICPDLNIVEVSSGTAPRLLLKKCKVDAVLVPVGAISTSDRKAFELIELGPEVMLPPPGLGSTVILTRTGDPLGRLLKSLDDPETRSCLIAERMLADALGRPPALACLATIDTDGAIRLQATLPGKAQDPRSALARVGASAPTPEAAARSCRFALEECLKG